MRHIGHAKLGDYCWTCMKTLTARTPGWEKKVKGFLGKSEALVFEVVWADGTRSSFNNCSICHNPRCSYPVHSERYGEVIRDTAKERDY